LTTEIYRRIVNNPDIDLESLISLVLDECDKSLSAAGPDTDLGRRISTAIIRLKEARLWLFGGRP